MSNARYSITQAKAVKDKRITHAQFRTLAALGMYSDEDGWCWPSQLTIGEDLGKGRQTVNEDIAALVELGYLEKHARFNDDGSQTSNMYRLLFDTPTPTPPVGTSGHPPSEPADTNVPIERPTLTSSEKKKILDNADPAWALSAGVELTQEAVDKNRIEEEAKITFERDMKFGALPWSSTRSWEKFENFVLKEFEKDNLIFAKYKTWQQNEGKFQAMSNRKIKERPEDFIACWPDFLAHSAMYGKKPEQLRLADTDEHGAIISY